MRPGVTGDLISTLRVLRAKLPGSGSNYLLYKILIQVDLDNGNIEKARENIEALGVMDKKGKLNKLIRGFKEQLRKIEKIPKISSKPI